MSDERPEALLKSALEKIIYFEARSEALHNDLATARDEASRLKAELAQASQRELELRRHLAETEVQLHRSHREREELGRMADALRGERGALIEKFIEATRIHQSDMEVEDGGFDLASFIAMLRSEAMGQPSRPAQGDPRAVVAPEPVAAPVPQAVAHAERLRAEGRLELQDAELTALTSHLPSMPGRTEETLFGFSLRELSAPDAAGRSRAAERLKALGQAAAAPALATALHRETESRVLVALLAAFAELAGEEGVAVVAPHLRARDPDVRISALKALLTLDASQAAPHLSAAMKDPDAAVRRRATLLALGLTADAALKLGTQAIDDGDAEVRAVGALALGAAGGEAARAPLLRALDDADEKVRAAAAKSVGRVLGEDVSAVVKLAEAQRRREIRRLATLPPRPVTAGLPLRASSRASAASDGVSGQPSVQVSAVSEGAGRQPSARATASAPAQVITHATAGAAPAVVAANTLAGQPAYALVGARSGTSVSALLNDSAGGRSTSGPARPPIVTSSVLPSRSSASASAPAPAQRPASAPVPGIAARAQLPGLPSRPAVSPSPAPVDPAVRSSATASVDASRPAAVTPSSPVASNTAAPANSEPPRALLSAVLTELRRSIRGLTLSDLSSSVGKPAPEIERACATLTARGDIVRRGIKFFVA